MANVNVQYDVDTTEYTTTSTGFANTSCRLDSDTGNGLTSGKTYLLMSHGFMRASVASGRVSIRLTANGVEIPGTHHRYQPGSAAWRRSFFVFTVYTSDGTDVILQARPSSGSTAQINPMTLIAVELDDLDSADWHWDEDTTSTALSTSWSSSNNAAITFTPSQAGDWLVLFSTQHDCTSDPLNHLARIERSGEASDTTLSLSEECTSSDEVLVFTLARLWSLGASSNTFTQKSSAASTPTTGDDRLRSAVFALRMDAFANWDGEYTAALQAITSTGNWDELVATATYTPNTASLDNIVIASALWESPDYTGRTLYGRIQEDDTTSLAGLEDVTGGPTYKRVDDVNDSCSVNQIGVSQWSAASHKFDWDVGCNQYTDDVDLGVRCTCIVAFSPELAAGEALVKVLEEQVSC